MTPTELDSCLDFLAKLWPAWSPTAEEAAIWKRRLSRYSEQAVRAAAEETLVRSKYATPRLAVILMLIGSGRFNESQNLDSAKLHTMGQRARLIRWYGKAESMVQAMTDEEVELETIAVQRQQLLDDCRPRGSEPARRTEAAISGYLSELDRQERIIMAKIQARRESAVSNSVA